MRPESRSAAASNLQRVAPLVPEFLPWYLRAAVRTGGRPLVGPGGAPRLGLAVLFGGLLGPLALVAGLAPIYLGYMLFERVRNHLRGVRRHNQPPFAVQADPEQANQ